MRGAKGWIGTLNGDDSDVALWGITNDGDTGYIYVHEHMDISQWDSVYDNFGPGKWDAYRLCCISGTWIGQSLFMLLFGSDTGTSRNELIAVWDHDSYFDYSFRWMSQDYSKAQALYNAKYTPNQIGGQQYTGSPLIDALWANHKSTFPNVFRTQP